MTDLDRVRREFDEIAIHMHEHGSGSDLFDDTIVARIPADARSVLDVGSGLGRLAAKIAATGRRVVGIDLSQEMVARARKHESATADLTFVCGDVLDTDLPDAPFDCVVTAATLHHVPYDEAIPRMKSLVRPGGRIVIHDLVADSGAWDRVRSLLALAVTGAGRFLRSGRLREPRAVREAWERHGAGDTYLTIGEVRAMAEKWFPGAEVVRHLLWRYTLTWDRPVEELRYRPALLDDIPAMSVLRLSVKENRLSDPSVVSRSDYVEHLTTLGRGWVCETESGEIVGFSNARLGDGVIWALFVKPGHEGRGIGTRLLDHALAWLASEGVGEARLSTAPGTRAERFYVARGWERGENTPQGEVTFRKRLDRNLGG